MSTGSFGSENLGTPASTYRNLLLTMTLGGLWHGAAMTFVLWGIWHGAALCLERFYRPDHRFLAKVPTLLRWAGTILVVLMGWVLFRSPDWSTAAHVYARLWIPASWLPADEGLAIVWLPPLTLVMIGVMVVEHLVWRTSLRPAMRLPPRAWYSPIATAILVWSLLVCAPRGFRPFVYFQF